MPEMNNVFICSETRVGVQRISINLFEPVGNLSKEDWDQYVVKHGLRIASPVLKFKVHLQDEFKNKPFELWKSSKDRLFFVRLT